MGKETGISWTDATWNPIRGCSRVSDGCRNCYAEKVAYRFSGPGKPYEGLVRINAAGERKPEWNGQVQFVEKHLLDPLKWRPVLTGIARGEGSLRHKAHRDGSISVTRERSRRIFVNSMSDLFHENVTDEMRDRIFAVMALCPHHTFQVLTKRPERMLAYCKTLGRHHEVDRVSLAMKQIDSERGAAYSLTNKGWAYPNIHFGVSVENAAAKHRIDTLREVPAALRFLSLEPLLGELGELNLDGIGWVIVGGESGPGARPMHPDWARSLRDQCEAAGVPFFFKQWGEWKPICNMPEDEYNAFYVSDKKAPAEWRQGEYDDVHGRRCTVPIAYLGYGGATELTDAYQSVDGHGGMMFFRVGKKAAGHLLDGKEWHQFPKERGEK